MALAARPLRRSTAALERTAVRNGPGRPAGSRHSLTPSTLQWSSSSTCPAQSAATTPSGTKRALFQRTRGEAAAAAGGHTVRGGTTKPMSSRNGKQELKHTAGASALRAVASSHSSSMPSRAMAAVTAEYSESLW